MKMLVAGDETDPEDEAMETGEGADDAPAALGRFAWKIWTDRL